MGKIIFEDRTAEVKETSENNFHNEPAPDESVVSKFVDNYLPIFVVDATKLGLYPKETIFAVYSLAQTLSEYYDALGYIIENEIEEYKIMSKKMGKDKIQVLKDSGKIEEIKATIKKIKEEYGVSKTVDTDYMPSAKKPKGVS